MIPTNETKQTEKTEYDPNVLSPEERGLLLAYNEKVGSAKIRIHDLNTAREQIDAQITAMQRERDRNEAFFGATCNAFGASRGLPSPVTISPDFTRIEGAKQQ